MKKINKKAKVNSEVKKEEVQLSMKEQIKNELIKARPVLDKEFARFGFEKVEYDPAFQDSLVAWEHKGKEYSSLIIIDKRMNVLRLSQHKHNGREWEQTAFGVMSPLSNLIFQATKIYFIDKKYQEFNTFTDVELMNSSIIPGTNGDA